MPRRARSVFVELEGLPTDPGAPGAGSPRLVSRARRFEGCGQGIMSSSTMMS